MLRNGKWSKELDPYQTANKNVEFIRKMYDFRSWITTDGSAGKTGKKGFKAEPNRYHLFVNYACPFACRTLMARTLKGLEPHISVTAVRPFATEEGWSFGDFPGTSKEPFFNATYLHELYTKTSPNYSGRVNVPVLWDKQQNIIVNNNSTDILEMLNSAFGDLARNKINLRPKNLLNKINALNETIHYGINDGVYKAGFARTQTAYEESYNLVFETLDQMEDNLRFSDFLLGSKITEPDIRLFVTLVRFDAVYYGLFKCNKKRISDYPALSKYIQEIYSLPGIAATVNLDHIKTGYYSVKALNPLCIVPLGPEEPSWNTPSNNNKLTFVS